MANTPVCEGCESLKRERDIAFRSWREQSAHNHHWDLRGKADREAVDRSKREYEQAAAMFRLHEATDHPEEGRPPSSHDLNLLCRQAGG
jgi:hypothetical protein